MSSKTALCTYLCLPVVLVLVVLTAVTNFIGRRHDSTDDNGSAAASQHVASETALEKRVIDAIQEDDTADLTSLLNTGLDANLTFVHSQEGNRSLLINAAEAGHADIVQLLLTHGADPNVGDATGFTPLIYAVCSRAPDIVDLLLHNGASVNQLTVKGGSALASASAFGDIEIMQRLVESGASVNPQLEHEGAFPPLTAAAMNYQREAMQWLLDNGASVDAISEESRPLFKMMNSNATASDDTMACVTLMVDAGNDPSTRHTDRDGGTLTHYAARYLPDLQVLDYLISEGAVIDEADIDGKTPLSYAIVHRKPEMAIAVAQRLIDAGADINGQHDGVTPLFCAVWFCHEIEDITVVQFLIDNGADLSLRNGAGQSIIDVAEEATMGDLRNELVQVLREAMEHGG
ncbi:MAG: ankyrin repeat domain-containing protein [Planctomycetes bacterium]|nr:ankyrin repeat domain-containing protein [Planctomycetota bacterium]NOG54990.1 hypothetical protein [Planctomycetota bacterium]